MKGAKRIRYHRHPKTLNEMKQYYDALDQEEDTVVKIKIKKNNLPNSYDDITTDKRYKKSWKVNKLRGKQYRDNKKDNICKNCIYWTFLEILDNIEHGCCNYGDSIQTKTDWTFWHKKQVTFNQSCNRFDKE